MFLLSGISSPDFQVRILGGSPGRILAVRFGSPPNAVRVLGGVQSVFGSPPNAVRMPSPCFRLVEYMDNLLGQSGGPPVRIGPRFRDHHEKHEF